MDRNDIKAQWGDYIRNSISGTEAEVEFDEIVDEIYEDVRGGSDDIDAVARALALDDIDIRNLRNDRDGKRTA